MTKELTRIDQFMYIIFHEPSERKKLLQLVEIDKNAYIFIIIIEKQLSDNLTLAFKLENSPYRCLTSTFWLHSSENYLNYYYLKIKGNNNNIDALNFVSKPYLESYVKQVPVKGILDELILPDTDPLWIHYFAVNVLRIMKYWSYPLEPIVRSFKDDEYRKLHDYFYYICHEIAILILTSERLRSQNSIKIAYTEFYKLKHEKDSTKVVDILKGMFERVNPSLFFPKKDMIKFIQLKEQYDQSKSGCNNFFNGGCNCKSNNCRGNIYDILRKVQKYTSRYNGNDIGFLEMGGTKYIQSQPDYYFEDQIKKMIKKSPAYETLQKFPDVKVKKLLEDIFYEEKSQKINSIINCTEIQKNNKFKLFVERCDEFYNDKKKKIMKEWISLTRKHENA